LIPSLIIGDIHCTPQEIKDCESLAELIVQTCKEYTPKRVIFMGDLYNNHDVVNTLTISYYTKLFSQIEDIVKSKPVVIVGNHDQYTPSIRHPHAMLSHTQGAVVIDGPCRLDDLSCGMPYYYDPKEFIQEAVKLKEQNPDCETLWCHQTFDGAKLQEGFYAKDGVDQDAVPFKTIISGHIHGPTKMGKVLYVGAPRWRTLTDSEYEDRFLLLLGGKPVKISTNKVCKRIYKYEDRESTPCVIDIPEELLPKADIRVDIYGSPGYIKDRIVELRAKYGVKYRTFPISSRISKVSESQGVSKAFDTYCEMFKPPFGSKVESLIESFKERSNGLRL